ncbi:achaete-scute homolog 2-like [Chiloscyllium plagiosum]|uniref:achaete-scute homolog 2-like n=1 Tax=Chiloscyllium plagiosum TaxID=36176 RepID=UPI001CB7C7E8|nr:achaete-scute homolog 2-like [Chiloscyllium plagiosum]
MPISTELEPGARALAGRKGRASPAVLSRGPRRAADAGDRRNARERDRVRLVNLGFANLQRHVPQSRAGKRMSKVDTLRSASNYIRALELLLREPGTQDSPRSTISVTVSGSPSDSSPSDSPPSDSPLSSYSSGDTSQDSSCSGRDLVAYKEWLRIE